MDDGEYAMNRIIAALHRMGVDKVYDTVTGADLTVIEETREFIDRLENGGTLPLFTSCLGIICREKISRISPQRINLPFAYEYVLGGY